MAARLPPERLAALARLRAAGLDPYPNDFRPAHTAAELHRRFPAGQPPEGEESAETFAVAGRIVGLRSFGRAAFLTLQDRTGRLQAHLRRDVLGEAFAILDLLDLGDFVGVVGPAFRTRTGELTLRATTVRLLAKALRPLPEKWHGLSDVETRYRQRYLDLIVNERVRGIFELRSRLVQRIREFLTARDFLEVETPMMQPIAGGAAARPFVTHHNALGIDLYLRIAPELYLKRLLVGGFERVFELNRSFRNEGVSVQHNPEFTMLELYEAYATYEDHLALTETLLLDLAERLLGRRELVYQGATIDLAPPWPRLAMRDAVHAYAPEAARRAFAPADLEEREGLARFARAAGLPEGILTGPGGEPRGWGELLVECFEQLVAPRLVQPTFVTRFPVEVSPLSRASADDPRYADRYELYIGGREIANGFSELNDPLEQRARFEAQMARRARGDEEAHRLDEDFLRALEHGMPPAAGEGIGIDRLVMLFTDAPSIREVILFPLLRPEA
ncbi:MAG TPA: lysine--tRNA ligase [Thermodesulfobacteriota bacterium]|nr:lysine--tRNA ligase [Thermodesulfobacteriota bacterium]